MIFAIYRYILYIAIYVDIYEKKEKDGNWFMKVGEWQYTHKPLFIYHYPLCGSNIGTRSRYEISVKAEY